jgi:hypothetical protein
MKRAPLIPIENNPLIARAQTLRNDGFLVKNPNNYVYLKIDDAFILDLFPLLTPTNVQIPDYFGDDKMGAHISLIYPQEYKFIHEDDLHQEYRFEVQSLVQTKLGQKTYYALLVTSPQLLQVRQKYGLGDLLDFKGFRISFHITLAVTGG